MSARLRDLRHKLLIAVVRLCTTSLRLLGLRDRVASSRWRRAQRRRQAAEARGDFSGSHPAQFEMDLQLERILDRDGGFFVEAGANDGFTQSNTYWLERTRGWRGLLVEPIPELAEKARLIRPAAEVVQCALVPAGAEEGFVRMRFGGLMSGLASESDPRWAELGTAMGWQEPYEVDVPAFTLSSLLSRLDPPEVDLVSLDVEGYESSVLAGLDLDRHAPRHLLVEAHEAERDIPPIAEVLANRYRVHSWLSPTDLLLVREDVAQSSLGARHGAAGADRLLAQALRARKRSPAEAEGSA